MNLRPFQRVLVANRGEIAVRIIRGCHEMGKEAVAVYSDADRDALHVRMADDARRIGPAPSNQSYLCIDRLVDAARETGCDAVHPGYGFLSENPRFARAVLEAGLVWIGPPPAAIESMGSKTGARTVMSEAGVPVVPGTLSPVSDDEEALRIALEIGLPVMIKAASGGGGKGMRKVFSEDELPSALRSARSEALKSFGDASIYLEKLVVDPRHVEIQVLADGHGSVVHLFERDCSIQRRNQKVVEEAPCPVLAPETRDAMTQAAIRATKAVEYVGAGTCEFLLGGDGAFYFLEMNTRLQVEHAITEAITGIDLVRAQIRVAEGESLWFTQDQIAPRGHALEFRIYAEDPRAGFRPSPGRLLGYREPAGPWVRVDSGVTSGSEVSIHYDPMVSKLIVWGPTRDEALQRARQALEHYLIVGIPTSIPFFLALLDDPDFRAGHYDTGFIRPEWLDAQLATDEDDLELANIAAAVLSYAHRVAQRASTRPSGGARSRWRWRRDWSTSGGR